MFSRTKYRRDIQVLRGLAVLAVVLFHAKASYFPHGYLGVDIFFVISGFVVTCLIMQIFTDQANTRTLLSNLRYFYERRFYRLAPALIVTLTISAILIFLLAPVSDHQKFAKQGIATLLLAGNLGASKYTGDYFSPNPNPLVHTWSLSVEQQIYIFLPIILMLILYKRTNQKKVTIVALGLISVISLILFLYPVISQSLYSRLGIEFSSQFSFYSPIERIWQFTVGGLAFLLQDRYQNRIRQIPKAIHLLTVVVVLLILFGPIHMNLKVSSFLATSFGVVMVLSKSLDVLPNFLILKLEWIGDRSYSIYLFHMPLLFIAKYSPVVEIGNSENRIIQSTVAVVASVLLGALSYSKIENRFRFKGKSKIAGIGAISVAVTLTFVIPLALFVAMDRGQKQQYWGLERTIQQPAYAGTLDPKCLRDSETGPPCVYTNIGASKTALLIGDSHAGHISEAFVQTAKTMNWNAVVWTHSGCKIQFKRSISERISDNCINMNNQMKIWVEENKPHTILVSQYVYSDSSQSNLRHGLSTLRSIVPNMLLIENNPIFPDGNDFMIRRPLIMPQYEPPKKFAQSIMQSKDKNASNMLANWARNNGISTMNFDSIFCSREICTRWSDSGWLYRDADHFSVAGAELTIPSLIMYFKRF
jgi:peptidoglycan/LPS O-acetylase OafA/YrhL